jgi:fibronectin-binding autotransporter adhesin
VARAPQVTTQWRQAGKAPPQFATKTLHLRLAQRNDSVRRIERVESLRPPALAFARARGNRKADNLAGRTTMRHSRQGGTGSGQAGVRRALLGGATVPIHSLNEREARACATMSAAALGLSLAAFLPVAAGATSLPPSITTTFTATGTDTNNYTGGPGTVTLQTTLPGVIGTEKPASGSTIEETVPSISLQIDGPGTIVLTGPNTFTGGTTLGSTITPPANGGTLSIQNSGSLGSGTVTFAADYTLEGNPTTSPLALANAITVNSGVTATVAATASNVFALASPITNASGTISFGSANDTGTVALGTANTYTGATVVNGGTVFALTAGAFSATSATTVNTGATLNLGGSAQTINNVTLAGGGITNGSLTGAIVSNGGGINGIGGSATLTANSGGTLLVGANTYTGATTINSGATLMGGGANTFSAVSATTINTGGTLNLGNLPQTINAVALAGGTIEDGSLTGTITSTGGTVNTIAGSASLTTTSGATTALGANTYTGTTNVNGGTLDVTGSIGSAGTPTGAINVASGATLTVGGAIVSGGNLMNVGNILITSTASTLSAGTFTQTGGITDNSGVLIGTTSIAINGGTLFNEATGTATTAALTIGASGTVDNLGVVTSTAPVANAGTLNNVAGATLNGGLTNSGTATNAGALNGGVSNSGTFTTTGIVTGGLTNAGIANAAGTIGGSIANSGIFNVTGALTGNGAFTNEVSGAQLNVNSGVYTLSGLLTNSGSVTVASGATLNASASGVLNESTGTIKNLGTLNDDLSNAGIVANSATYTGNVASNSGTITNAAGTWTGNVNAGANVAGGSIINQATWIGTGNNAGGTIDNQATWAGAIINTSGTFTNEGTVTSGLTNSGTFTTTGAVAGGVSNTATGTANAAGTIDGSIANSGIFNVTGALTGNGAFTNEVSGAQLNVNSGVYDLTGLLTNSGSVTVASGAGLNGSMPGILNTATGTISNLGTLNDDLSNAGAVTNNGAYNGNVASNSGTITNAAAGIWTGNVNAGANVAGGSIINKATWNGTGDNWGGTIDNQATWAGAIINTSGTFTNEGTVTLGLTNSGTATNSGTINDGVSNSGTFTTTNTVAGGVTNTATGTANAAGTIGGAIANSGVFNVTGALTGNGAFTNEVSGAQLNVNSGVYTLSGLLTNSGSVTVASGATLNASGSGVLNESTGTIKNFGTLKDDLNNAGAVTNNGAYTGNVASNSGTITNAAGTWTGNVNAGANVAGGSIINKATWTGTGNNAGGTIDNQATWAGAIINTSGTFINEATGVVTGNVTNSGILDASGMINGAILNIGAGTVNVIGNLASGTVTNNGIVKIPGTQTLTVGSFVNAGTIDLTNGNNVANTATITGSYTGQGAAQLKLNVNAVVGNTGQQANFLRITGNASGGPTTVVVTPLNGNPTLFPNLIPIISVGSGGTASSFVAANGGAIPGGQFGNLVTYGIMQQGNTYDVFSHVNVPAIGPIAGSIGAAIGSATTGFFQGSTAFLGQPANATPDQIDYGVWTRGASGMNSDKSVVTSSVISTPTDLKTDTHFSGYQVGSDVGMFNIQNSGWNLHAGITGGEYVASASEANFGESNSSYTVPFLGLYAAVTGHGFYADALVRHDFWSGSVTSQDAGITNASMNGNGNAATVEAGYRYDLPYGFFVTPSAGFAYTRATFSPLTLLPASPSFTQLAIGAVQSDLGRLGLQVGDVISTTYWTLIPNVNVSVWHEFAGQIPSVFTVTAPGQSVFTDNLDESRVGTFGQFGVGLAVQPVQNPNYTGYIRVDYRTGSNINGATLTGGFRYQF